MLGVPPAGFASAQSNVTSTSAAGTTITASGTTHTKGSYSQLIASTDADSYGIVVVPTGVAVSATDTQMLVDVAIGTTIIIPDLIAGMAGPWGGFGSCGYYFPLYIPVGSQVQARCQALIASDTCDLMVWLMQRPLGPLGFVGSRVTAYGIDAANSRGTAHTSNSSSSYATAVSLDASTDDVIRYLQLGYSMTGTALTASRVHAELRLGSSSVVAGPLPLMDNASEQLGSAAANLLLSQMSFDIPAASDLTVTSRASSNATRYFAAYGVA